MAKTKVRVKPGKTAKRWRKGQSGASNPVTKRHRDAAKGRLGNHLAQTKPSESLMMKLTTDLLASHDGNHNDDIIGEDLMSHGAESSVYSLIDTAHPVFGKVKRLWNSREESHKQICAVLAAVTEVVKSNPAATNTEMEYFGALLTLLEASDSEQSTTAIAFLLSIVMEQLTTGGSFGSYEGPFPSPVIVSRFGQVSKILMSQLTKHETSSSTSLLKSLLSCITILLSAQPSHKWKDSYVQTMFQTVVNFTIHPKPRLRRSLQQGIEAMLLIGDGNKDFHPSCPLLFKQYQRILESGGNDDTVKLHVLRLLRDVFSNFPTKHIKGLCELILKLLTLGSTTMKMACFQCLNGLFSSVVLIGPQGLTPELNGQLISALYGHQPDINDSQLLVVWSTLMKDAIFRLDPSLRVDHLPNMFSVLMKCLLSPQRSSVMVIVEIITEFLRVCVSSVIKELDEESCDKKSKSYTIVQSIFRYT